MSTKTILASAAFSAIVGAWLLAADAAPSPTVNDAAVEGPVAAAPPPAAGRWEYKVLPRREIVEMAPGHQGEYILPKDLLEDLNSGLQVLGAEGWELVAIEPYHTEGYVKWPAMYVFRRPN